MPNPIIAYALHNPKFFRAVLSYFYPLSANQLEKYKSFLDWRYVSQNEFISWDYDLIKKYSDLLNWVGFTSHPTLWQNQQLLNQFESNIIWQDDLLSYATIAYNKGVDWNSDQIEKYADKLNFTDLSANSSVLFTEKMIDLYKDKLDWTELSGNPSLPWSVSFIIQYINKLHLDEFFFQINPSLTGNLEIVEIFGSLLTPFAIFSNPNLPWIEQNLLKKWEDNLDWYGIAGNPLLLSDKDFFLEHESKLINTEYAYLMLSENTGLPWSEELIDKHIDLWEWERLSINKTLPWSESFIEKHTDNLVWGGLEKDFKEIIPSKHEYGYDFISGCINFGMIHNSALPWSIDLLLKYEDNIDFEELVVNKGMWEKAFKPNINDEVIDMIISIL
jgi:hypothetical protein